MIYYAWGDAISESVVFGLQIGGLLGAVYTVLFLFLGLPMLLIICLNLKFWRPRRWLILLLGIVLGLLGVALVGFLQLQEHVVLVDLWLTSYGIAYGCLGGVMAILRFPKYPKMD